LRSVNQFPEWFTVQADATYRVAVGERSSVAQTGAQLTTGLDLSVDPGTPISVIVTMP
jgi:hypothetical protein